MKNFFYSISFISFFVCMFAVTASASFSTDFGSTTLKRGSSGQYVTNLQIALNSCVANTNLTTDGHFGMGTKRAVMAFQVSKGVKADGSVGARTKALLMSVGCGAVYEDKGSLAHKEIVLGQTTHVLKAITYIISGTNDTFLINEIGTSIVPDCPQTLVATNTPCTKSKNIDEVYLYTIKLGNGIICEYGIATDPVSPCPTKYMVVPKNVSTSTASADVLIVKTIQ